mgnify:CR=1 FL=1
MENSAFEDNIEMFKIPNSLVGSVDSEQNKDENLDQSNEN